MSRRVLFFRPGGSFPCWSVASLIASSAGFAILASGGREPPEFTSTLWLRVRSLGGREPPARQKAEPSSHQRRKRLTACTAPPPSRPRRPSSAPAAPRAE